MSCNWRLTGAHVSTLSKFLYFPQSAVLSARFNNQVRDSNYFAVAINLPPVWICQGNFSANYSYVFKASGSWCSWFFNLKQFAPVNLSLQNLSFENNNVPTNAEETLIKHEMKLYCFFKGPKCCYQDLKRKKTWKTIS